MEVKEISNGVEMQNIGGDTVETLLNDIVDQVEIDKRVKMLSKDIDKSPTNDEAEEDEIKLQNED